MVVSFAHAAMLTVVPATIGWILGSSLLIRPIGAMTPEARGRALIFVAIPLTAVLFAVVISVLVQDLASIPDGVLASFGVAAFACALTQGYVASRGLPVIAADANAFGRVLVLTVLPETIVLFGFVLIFLAIGRLRPEATTPFVYSSTSWPAFAGGAILTGVIMAAAAFKHMRSPFDQKRLSDALRMAAAGEVFVLGGFILTFVSMR